MPKRPRRVRGHRRLYAGSGLRVHLHLLRLGFALHGPRPLSAHFGAAEKLARAGGKLVFAVETVADRCPDDTDYREAVAVPMQGGHRIVLRTKNHYDPATQTQYAPGFYELYAGDDLLEREFMDFQTHLYRFGEMEAILAGLDFATVCTYASFDKHPAVDDSSEMFLFECSL